MKFTLFDYQDEATANVLVNLRKARKRWHEDADRHSFSLSAPTAAGKTVMAAAVFEALFHGDDDYDFVADPGAVVIWFSDDPSLNEQTRWRLLEAADRIDFSDLVVVENTFNQEKFAPGTVYFLNTQKLGKNSLLTRGHDPYEVAEQAGAVTLPEMRPDGRSFTIWDTIQNTIEDPDLTLYLVLDEAHRGMGKPRKSDREARSTIVKRLINGSGSVPPMPIVWGISATVDRFNEAMAGATERSTLPNVTVDTAKVQESGLLKDTVLLETPDEAGAFDTVLMRRATTKLMDSTQAWEQYATDRQAKLVRPLMVYQVPNTPDHDKIGDNLATIFETWPDLSHEAVAHVLGEHKTQHFGPYAVPYISPERVQQSDQVRVLIAKDAISTGWDCPRAEVMISFRPAVEPQYITQLLGRMVRTPLARRIPGNDRLNSVDCILPKFDRKNVHDVADKLMHGDDSDTTPPLRRVLINPAEMTPNHTIPEDVWTTLESLPSQSLPQRASKPVKRLTALAHELAADGLLADAGKKAHAEMHKTLDAAAVQYQEQIAAARNDVLTVEGYALSANIKTKTKTFEQFVAEADYAVIEDAYRNAARQISPDLARTYAEYLADANTTAETPEEALLDAHTDIAALGLAPEVKEYLDAQADKLTEAWLTKYRVQIKELSDDRREVYRQITEMSADPQDIDLARPEAWMQPTTAREADGTEHPLPLFDRHLLSNADGDFPCEWDSSWEGDVLATEMGRESFVAWYRNPSHSSQDSLAVAYEHEGRIKMVRPDFIFFNQVGGDIKASIIDPHGTQYTDALPKLRGLAAYAATHGDHYLRIEAIAKADDKLRALDLTDPAVRDAISNAEDAASLYLSTAATDYS